MSLSKSICIPVTLFLIFFFSNANAEVSNIKAAGMCYGHVAEGMMAFKMNINDFDKTSKSIAIKYAPTFKSVWDKLVLCANGKGDISTQTACVNKLSDANEKDFINGYFKAADYVDANGPQQTKFNASLICNGVK